MELVNDSDGKSNNDTNDNDSNSNDDDNNNNNNNNNNHKAKLVWDFEFHLRNTTTARRPNLILELKEDEKIWICDMVCPQQNNIETKRIEKMKYRQLAFETRERRPSYDVYVLPVVIGALGGGIKTLRKDLKKVFRNNELLDEVVATMQKTVLMDSESIIRRVMSGLIQGEEDE